MGSHDQNRISNPESHQDARNRTVATPRDLDEPESSGDQPTAAASVGAWCASSAISQQLEVSMTVDASELLLCLQHSGRSPPQDLPGVPTVT